MVSPWHDSALCSFFLSILCQQIYLITDLDKFPTDDIMDPIAKAKMVALQGIKRVLAQDPMVVPPGINRYFCYRFCLDLLSVVGSSCYFSVDQLTSLTPLLTSHKVNS